MRLQKFTLGLKISRGLSQTPHIFIEPSLKVKKLQVNDTGEKRKKKKKRKKKHGGLFIQNGQMINMFASPVLSGHFCDLLLELPVRTLTYSIISPQQSYEAISTKALLSSHRSL